MPPLRPPTRQHHKNTAPVVPDPQNHSVSPLPNRSQSIHAILHTVVTSEGPDRLAHTSLSPQAYLPIGDRRRSQSAMGGAHFGAEGGRLFRESSFVKETNQFCAKAHEDFLRKQRDENVVLFPAQLRSGNRFLTDPKMSSKAAVVIAESRRPSSLFSESISSSCKEELHQIHKIKSYQDVKVQNAKRMSIATRKVLASGGGGGNGDGAAPPPGRTSSPLRQRAEHAAAFRPVTAFYDWTNHNDEITLFHGEEDSYWRGRNEGEGSFTTNPLFLRHVESDEREVLQEREKFGRRVEYGRMVGMFREELLASRLDTHSKVRQHPEVPSAFDVRQRKRDVPIDWSYMDLRDPAQLLELMPRAGELYESEEQKQRKIRLAAYQKRKAELERERLAQRNSAGGSRNSAGTKSSVVWKLRYCFSEADAEGILSRGMVVVEQGDVTYAFDPRKEHISRDLDAEFETAHTLEIRRKQQARSTMSVEELEEMYTKFLLDVGHSFQGTQVSLSNNRLPRIDCFLTNSLCVLVRTFLTKLDLSFNNISVIDDSFLTIPSRQERDERKRQTLNEAIQEEQEEERAEKHRKLIGSMLSEAQIKKRQDRFFALRRRAIRDLVDADSAARVFSSLHTLYLHGNPLQDISEVWKLEPLRRTLTSLTLHGHRPLDVQVGLPSNRRKLKQMFPNLVQLNFTTLTDEE